MSLKAHEILYVMLMTAAGFLAVYSLLHWLKIKL